MRIALRVASAAIAVSVLASAWPGPAAATDDTETTLRDLLVVPHGHAVHRRPPRPVSGAAMGAGIMSVAPNGLRIGEPVRLRMVALSDGYGHLYALSASGRTQLWLENVRLLAGEPIAFPQKRRILRASAPAGDETIVFVATRNRIDGFAGRQAMRDPLQLAMSHAQFREALVAKLDTLARADWTKSELILPIKD